MQITIYLTFNGNCREAMSFYRSCFGGQLFFQTMGDSPSGPNMPEEMKSAILQATLIKDNWILMASDIVADKGLQWGNNISLLLHCNSEQEINEYYENLAKDGQMTHPLEMNMEGALFGDLIDKYGNQWLLHYPLQSKPKVSNVLV